MAHNSPDRFVPFIDRTENPSTDYFRPGRPARIYGAGAAAVACGTETWKYMDPDSLTEAAAEKQARHVRTNKADDAKTMGDEAAEQSTKPIYPQSSFELTKQSAVEIPRPKVAVIPKPDELEELYLTLSSHKAGNNHLKSVSGNSFHGNATGEHGPVETVEQSRIDLYNHLLKKIQRVLAETESSDVDRRCSSCDCSTVTANTNGEHVQIDVQLNYLRPTRRQITAEGSDKTAYIERDVAAASFAMTVQAESNIRAKKRKWSLQRQTLEQQLLPQLKEEHSFSSSYEGGITEEHVSKAKKKRRQEQYYSQRRPLFKEVIYTDELLDEKSSKSAENGRQLNLSISRIEDQSNLDVIVLDMGQVLQTESLNVLPNVVNKPAEKFTSLKRRNRKITTSYHPLISADIDFEAKPMHEGSVSISFLTPPVYTPDGKQTDSIQISVTSVITEEAKFSAQFTNVGPIASIIANLHRKTFVLYENFLIPAASDEAAVASFPKIPTESSVSTETQLTPLTTLSSGTQSMTAFEEVSAVIMRRMAKQETGYFTLAEAKTRLHLHAKITPENASVKLLPRIAHINKEVLAAIQKYAEATVDQQSCIPERIDSTAITFVQKQTKKKSGAVKFVQKFKQTKLDANLRAQALADSLTHICHAITAFALHYAECTLDATFLSKESTDDKDAQIQLAPVRDMSNFDSVTLAQSTDEFSLASAKHNSQCCLNLQSDQSNYASLTINQQHQETTTAIFMQSELGPDQLFSVTSALDDIFDTVAIKQSYEESSLSIKLQSHMPEHKITDIQLSPKCDLNYSSLHINRGVDEIRSDISIQSDHTIEDMALIYICPRSGTTNSVSVQNMQAYAECTILVQLESKSTHQDVTALRLTSSRDDSTMDKSELSQSYHDTVCQQTIVRSSGTVGLETIIFPRITDATFAVAKSMQHFKQRKTVSNIHSHAAREEHNRITLMQTVTDYAAIKITQEIFAVKQTKAFFDVPSQPIRNKYARIKLTTKRNISVYAVIKTNQSIDEKSINVTMQSRRISKEHASIILTSNQDERNLYVKNTLQERRKIPKATDWESITARKGDTGTGFGPNLLERTDILAASIQWNEETYLLDFQAETACARGQHTTGQKLNTDQLEPLQQQDELATSGTLVSAIANPESVNAPGIPAASECRRLSRRIFRAAFLFQLLMMFLLCAVCLVPHWEDDCACAIANNFAKSFHPKLYHVNGPPPT